MTSNMTNVTSKNRVQLLHDVAWQLYSNWMYETYRRALFTNGDVKKKNSEEERRQLDFKNRYLQSRESPNSPWRTDSSQTSESECLNEC